jgi:lambda family phage portal protein
VLDTDQLYTEKNDPTIGLINGVRRDGDGRRISYFLYDRHPELPGAKVVEVPADQILHLYLRHFVGQTRGIPWMAPVMIDVHRLDQYDKAELVAAQIAACQMGFWKQELAKEEIKDASYDGKDSSEKQPTSAGTPVMMEPGSYTVGGPNDSIQMFKPEHPVAAFEPFKRTCLQGISAGIDVAYMSLSGDVGAANYSSARTGLLDERATWEMVQRWFIEELCTPVFSEGWLPQAFLRDPLRTLLPGSDYKAYDKAEWHPRSFPWVDPLKDAQAVNLKVQNGLSTLTRELNAQGYDLEETLLELAAERQRIKELGLKLGTDTKGAADTASGFEDDEAEQGKKKKADANA